MQAFSYERPETVAAALDMLAVDQAKVLAGGTDLIPQLREGRRKARVVVDVKHIPELTRISRGADGGWYIGAAVGVRELCADVQFCADYPGLIEAVGLIGSLQIQSRATLGGNLCNGAPSADGVPLLISLGVQTRIAGPQGERIIPIGGLPRSPGQTNLGMGELLIALLLPPRPARSAARYLRFTPRREMDIAIAGSGVAVTLRASGEIETARITLASVAPVPLRAEKAEQRLVGEKPDARLLIEAGQIASSEARPISDTRGSADYRRELVGVLTRRALEACVAEATNGGLAP